MPTQLPAKHDSQVAASITYISDPKELAHLPNGEDFDNVYLFVAVPSKIQIKSIVDTASKLKQKYAVIYEQQFNSHNYGLLKKVRQSFGHGARGNNSPFLPRSTEVDSVDPNEIKKAA